MTEFLVGPEDMRNSYRIFFGREPSPSQLRIFEGFPSTRGVADSSEDSELFEAAVVMAVVQTYTKKQAPEPHKVYFFVSGVREKWATKELRSILERIFGRLKDRKAVDHAQVLGKVFRSIFMGCRVLPFENPPERWVSFGFLRTDPLPKWLVSSLLELESVRKNPVVT